MLGRDLEQYFEVFSTFVIYQIDENGQPTDNDGWVDFREYMKILQKRLETPGVTLDGVEFDQNCDEHRNLLFDVTSKYLLALKGVHLFSRRESTWPPKIEYKKTKLAQMLQGWKLGPWPKKWAYCTFFFFVGLYYLCLRWKFVITFAAGVFSTINALKLFGIAFHEISFWGIWGWAIITLIAAFILAKIRNSFD